MDTCDKPPAGWRCTREPDHAGPCAAVPVDAIHPTIAAEIVAMAVTLARCTGKAHRNPRQLWCPDCRLYVDCCERVARQALGTTLWKAFPETPA